MLHSKQYNHIFFLSHATVSAIDKDQDKVLYFSNVSKKGGKRTGNFNRCHKNVITSYEIIGKYIDDNDLNKTSNFRVFLSYGHFVVKPTLILVENCIIRGNLNDTKSKNDKIKEMQKSVIMFENLFL